MKYGIDAVVKIVSDVTAAPMSTAGGDKLIFDTRRGDRGLLGVSVSNSIDGAPGRFTLEFTPEAVTRDGRGWAEAIAPYSLAAIALHRRTSPLDHASTSAPEPVMLGLVDTRHADEDFSQAAPHREHRLRGRALTAVLTDCRWWSHSWLASTDRETGKSVLGLPADLRSYFKARPSALELEAPIRVAGLLAVFPNLLNPPDRSPVSTMKLVFDFFVRGLANAPLDAVVARAPFIKVQFADGVPLADRLNFDVDRARASFVDPEAWLMQQVLPTSTAALASASCWDFLRQFSDEHLQELYSDTFGTSVDDARVEVIARKKPFAGHLSYPGPKIDFSTRSRPPLRGASLFDARFGDWWERTSDTVYIDDSDLVSWSLQSGDDQIFNTYAVTPLVPHQAGASRSDKSWQQVVPPVIDEFDDSPSWVTKWGIRPLSYVTSYIAGTFDVPAPTQNSTAIDQCVAYECLLREWHYRNPEMWHGSITLKGSTWLRAGRRLVYRGRHRVMEFYILAVHHSVRFHPVASFRTTVTVARGWPLGPGAI